MRDASHCINCHRAIDIPDQKFCPACGQPTPTHRIDWHFLGHELEHSVLHMDRGILYSLKELMLRPGRLIRGYLEGQRANQVKPLMLIMIMAAVVVVLTRYVVGGGVMDLNVDVGHAGANAPIDPAVMDNLLKSVADWMNGHFALITLLLLPFEAMALKLAFRRFRDLNYPEWLVITAFLTVQMFVIWVLLMPLHHWMSLQMTVSALAIGCNVFSLVQFFRGYPRWKTVLRALFGFAIYLVFNGVLTIALTTVMLALSLRG